MYIIEIIIDPLYINEILTVGEIMNMFFNILSMHTSFTSVNVNLMGVWEEIQSFDINKNHIQILPNRPSINIGDRSHWVTFYF